MASPAASAQARAAEGHSDAPDSDLVVLHTGGLAGGASELLAERYAALGLL